jgi:Fe-S-cluster containining protein
MTTWTRTFWRTPDRKRYALESQSNLDSAGTFHMDSTPGYRFACVPGCSRCCDVEGYVYLTENDLQSAAAHLGLSAAEFESRYVYRTRHLIRLRKPKGPEKRQCHFRDSRGCSIHAVKPVQCRLFPFWPEMVENVTAWRETARSCPGIGTGPLIQIGTALETASEMKQAYPRFYLGE